MIQDRNFYNNIIKLQAKKGGLNSNLVAVLHRCTYEDNCRVYISLTNNNFPRNGNNQFYSPTIIIDVTERQGKERGLTQKRRY